MRYPLGSLVACLILYTIGVRVTWLMHMLVTDGKSFPLVVVWLCSGFWVVTFISRAIYLVTTGLCRLGDGHPLLPPFAGMVIAWAVAIMSLLSSSGGGGEPGMITALVLLGGPVSITALSAMETWRLRVKYPTDFPFRDGPLPPRSSAVTHGYSR
jgi:branched-subunit amino acid transport protein